MELMYKCYGLSEHLKQQKSENVNLVVQQVDIVTSLQLNA